MCGVRGCGHSRARGARAMAARVWPPRARRGPAKVARAVPKACGQGLLRQIHPAIRKPTRQTSTHHPTRGSALQVASILATSSTQPPPHYPASSRRVGTTRCAPRRVRRPREGLVVRERPYPAAAATRSERSRRGCARERHRQSQL